MTKQSKTYSPSITSGLEFGAKGPLILLFYDGYEVQAREGAVGRLRSLVRGRLRATVRKLRGKQVNTGFYVAFLSLCASLRHIGCNVRINDFGAARARPEYPIGIAGYPSIFEHVHLPNPTIFGPGDPGWPDEAAARPNLDLIIQPSDWFVDYYRPTCGDRMVRWPAGIDCSEIADASDKPKAIDVLIYDKIRWNHEIVAPRLLDPLIDILAARGLSYDVVRYGSHTQADFFQKLGAARAFAFLCEHETQGLACEEAMAMNVPIFAWDEGELVDPQQKRRAPAGITVSSVPYFDERCGVRFQIANIDSRFDEFWSQRAQFRPRDYVTEELSMEKCGRAYLELYSSLLKR